MKAIRVFNGVDEASSNHPQAHRARYAFAISDPELSDETVRRAVVALQSGEPDPVIDALCVQCPMCGYHLEAQERYYCDAQGREFTWQIGSEHYVSEHRMFPAELGDLLEAMGP